MRELTQAEMKTVSAGSLFVRSVRQNQANGSVNVLSFNNVGVNVGGIQFQNSGQIA
jgi:hypothetical protein